jgi:hypothetical protein
MQWVILLDIDGTLVDGLGNYNQGLLSALCRAQQNYPLHIVLFTAYEWGENFIQKTQRGLTRLAVYQTLIRHGLKIDAVVVSGSNQDETEPAAFGHYYESVFRPIEAQCLTYPYPSAARVQQILDQYPALAQRDAEYKTRNQTLRTIDTCDQGGNDNKEPIFRHVLRHYGHQAQFLVLDDNAAVLAAARYLREQEGYPIQHYLTTVQAYRAGLDSETSYFCLLAKTFSWPVEPIPTPSTSSSRSASLPLTESKSKWSFWRLLSKQQKPSSAQIISSSESSTMAPALPIEKMRGK